MVMFLAYSETVKSCKKQIVCFLFCLFVLSFTPESIFPEAIPDSTTTLLSHKLLRLATSPVRGGIRFYQLFISDQDLHSCSFNPSCSRFSLDAYQSTDPFQATLMTFDRLMRCNYFIYGEYPFVNNRFIDPVEENMLWNKPTGHDTASRCSLYNYEEFNIPYSDSISNTPSPDIRLADSMARSGETGLALEEYHRLAGSSYPKSIREQALFHSGWMYFERSEYTCAALKFNDILSFSGTDSQEYDNAALLKHLSLMKIDCFDTMAVSFKENTFEKCTDDYISAWGALHRGSFVEARGRFERLLKSSSGNIAAACAKTIALLDSVEMPVSKKGWISGTLSCLIPGLGRVYTGRYGDAFFSFCVTSATGGLAISTLRSGPWTKSVFFTGAATGFFLGNIYGSAVSARTENRRKRTYTYKLLESRAEKLNILPEQIISERLAACLPGGDPDSRPDTTNAAVSGMLSDADRSFSNSEWQKAERSYRRYLFYSPHGEEDRVLFRLGKALEYDRKNAKAIGIYDHLLDKYPKSEYADETRLSLAQLHLRDGNGDFAKLELEDEIQYGDNEEYSKKASYLTTWIFMQNYDWSQTLKWIDGHSDQLNSGEFAGAVGIIRDKLAGNLPLPRKSPRRAYYLSLVVPGLGQLYAGKTLNGLGAFVINGAIGYSLARSLHSENWLDAGLITVLLFDRYYSGNLGNAKQFCNEFNTTQNERLFKEIRDGITSFNSSYNPFMLNDR